MISLWQCLKMIHRDQKGATVVFVAIVLIVLFGFTALAIDVGNAYVVRNELQNVSDGAALAATRQLGQLYQAMTYTEQAHYVVSTEDRNLIVSQAHSVAANNEVNNQAVALLNQDIQIGVWQVDDNGDGTFVETLNRPYAVRVVSRRDNVANSPLATIFAGVMNINTMTISAFAVASLTGKSTADPGDLELPIGISNWFYNNPQREDFCDDTISFSPSNSPDSCAGWTSFEYNSNDRNLRHILDEDSGYDSPAVVAGEDAFNFIGGNLSNPTFDALLNLFRRKGHDLKPIDGNCESYAFGFDENDLDDLQPVVDVNGEIFTGHSTGLGACPLYDSEGVRLLYPDGTPRNMHAWETGVVVYDRGDCSNPNQTIDIVGFSDVFMFDVKDAPDKIVRGIVLCNQVDQGNSRGSGGWFGLLGSIPGLVQ